MQNEQFYQECDGPIVRAGPGRADLKIVMGRAGPGRADTVEKVMGMAWPRLTIWKLDRPGRAAAHDMWASHGQLCPAHEAVHVTSLAGPGRGLWCVVNCCYYGDDIHPAHETTHAFWRAGPGPDP